MNILLMEDTHYLPSEELKEANYPEIALVRDRLALLDTLTVEFYTSLGRYLDGEDPKIYMEVEQLLQGIALCRDILSVLGTAPNPCFDIIMDVRSIQEGFHEVYYAYKRYGDEYLGSWDTAVRGDL